MLLSGLDLLKRKKKSSTIIYANGVLNYADFATGKSVVLCTRPGCNHAENVLGEEPRDAEIPLLGQHMLFENNTLYYLGDENILYSRDATGGSLKELGVLTKNYSRREKGIYSLLGPNGAGKSTITSAIWYAGIGTALREIMPNSKSF